MSQQETIDKNVEGIHKYNKKHPIIMGKSKSKALHKAKDEPKFAGKSSWKHTDKDFHKLNAFFQRAGK